jgi:hypothetical protein
MTRYRVGEGRMSDRIVDFDVLESIFDQLGNSIFKGFR